MSAPSTGAKVVFIDYKRYLADLFNDTLRNNGLEVDTYYNPKKFIESLSRYDVNTKIITDNSFDDIGMTGDVVG